jgi:hypothetical protein
LAEQLAAALLGDPSTPDYVKEPSYAASVAAWGQAEAEARRLRARWDELDRLDAAEAVDSSLTEMTDTEEDEVRPSMGTMRRVSRSRQRESLSRALHRAEMRARTLRADLGLTPLSRARLGRDVSAARFDMALAMAADAEEEAAGSQESDSQSGVVV